MKSIRKEAGKHGHADGLVTFGLPGGVASAVLSYLDVRSHLRARCACAAINLLSRKPGSWHAICCRSNELRNFEGIQPVRLHVTTVMNLAESAWTMYGNADIRALGTMLGRAEVLLLPIDRYLAKHLTEMSAPKLQKCCLDLQANCISTWRWPAALTSWLLRPSLTQIELRQAGARLFNDLKAADSRPWHLPVTVVKFSGEETDCVDLAAKVSTFKSITALDFERIENSAAAKDDWKVLSALAGLPRLQTLNLGNIIRRPFILPLLAMSPIQDLTIDFSDFRPCISQPDLETISGWKLTKLSIYDSFTRPRLSSHVFRRFWQNLPLLTYLSLVDCWGPLREELKALPNPESLEFLELSLTEGPPFYVVPHEETSMELCVMLRKMTKLHRFRLCGQTATPKALLAVVESLLTLRAKGILAVHRGLFPPDTITQERLAELRPRLKHDTEGSWWTDLSILC